MFKTTKLTINKHLKPYLQFKNIAWFLFLFISFDVVWKLCVHEGKDESILLVFGYDMTSSMDELCLWTAKVVYWVVHDLFGQQEFLIKNTIVYFPNSLRINIIWGCTGIKQFIMFTFVILLYFGPLKKKLWYIALSITILAIINILRLAIISLLIKDGFPDWFITFNQWYNGTTWDGSKDIYWQFYKDWFNVFHRDIFVWIYYDGVMFILWLIWEEKINKPFQKLKKELKQKA